MAHSLASAPELAKKTCPPARSPPTDEPVEGGGHLGGEQVAEQVGNVEEGARLVGDGVGHRRMGVAERGHRQARTGSRGTRLPSVSKSTLPSTPDEGHRRLGVGAHEGRAVDARSSGVGPEWSSVQPDHRADPLVGEHLEQEGVGGRARRGCGPGPPRPAPRGRRPRASGSSPRSPRRSRPGGRARRPIARWTRVAGSSGTGPEPGDIGQEDELLGVEGGGERTGRGVGVDVEGLARLRRCRWWPPPG